MTTEKSRSKNYEEKKKKVKKIHPKKELQLIKKILGKKLKK